MSVSDLASELALRRKWLTVEEAHAHTGCGRTEIYAALQSGELPGSQRSKRGRWRVHLDDLDKWMRGATG